MKPLLGKLLIASASFSIALSLAWCCVFPRTDLKWIWTNASEVDCGTQICARCGAKREVFLNGMVWRRFVCESTREQAWAEQRIGACAEHSWQETGCFYDGGYSLTAFSAEHPLWKGLAALPDEQADEIATRFAKLPAERQIQLWQESQMHSLEGPSEVARLTAETAGWPDLAAHFARAR